ncbi:MAG: helix-turn-helix domain-containing protein, partial [Ktedonobacteraceae bacterium]|nr:helix-turn-helix domain-containing protein [Ktedonobacteraceae bacterium]
MRFGERLYQERLHRRLSQESLAEALGVSARSISRWEQGRALPQGYARLQLSRFFHLSPEELFADLEPQTPPTLVWTVPFPRNPYFTGREEIIQTLHTRLTSSQPTALTQA